MKWNFTFIMLLLVLNLAAQIKVENISQPISCVKQDQIKIRCRATINTSCKPLIVVDGIFCDSLSKVDPANIESISILKNSDATAIYGFRAMDGVVLITTKNSRLRQFVITDILDSKPIPSATVTFIPEKNSADSLMLMADDAGKISTDKLKPGASYLVRISSVGYIAYTTPYINKSNQPKIFNLTRNLVENVPVTVIGYGTRRYCGGCWLAATKIISSTVTQIEPRRGFKFYPNPVVRGAEIKIEWDDMKSSQLQARVIGLDGRLLFTRSYSSVEGKNILSLSTETRWANGTYFVQIIDESGKIIKQEKILVQ